MTLLKKIEETIRSLEESNDKSARLALTYAELMAIQRLLLVEKLDLELRAEHFAKSVELHQSRKNLTHS